MFWPHSPVQSIYKGGNHQHLPQADAKEQFLQRFACKAVISQPGTKNANSGTNNRQTKAPTHTHKKRTFQFLLFRAVLVFARRWLMV